MSPSEFFDYVKQHRIQMLDLKFADLLGTWQHCSFPINSLDEDTFEDGLGFDGSSIRGWQDIQVSDLVALPDAETARLDPFFAVPTVSLLANIVDPTTREAYTRDPRNVARKATAFLARSGIADVCYIGPEPEFFIFDEVRFEQTANRAYCEIDSVEGAWNTARSEEPNLGYKPSFKGGYFPVCPTDTYHDLRGEMTAEMEKIGIVVEAHHHEVGTAGQAEIDMRYAPLLEMGDQFMWFKYIVKNVARRHSKTVTFMPKPIFGDNGSGMHTHLSLWDDGEPLFSGDRYAKLSEMACYAIGGLLHHAPAIMAFAAPTINSYRRLIPGFEAPVNLAMSERNRSAAVRIPTYSARPESRRLEFRCPDPSANGYLMFSAVLMAVLHGIEERFDPGTPLDRNIYEMTDDELAGTRQVPASLEEALDALEQDHAFLTRGSVFTDDLIETWIRYKWDNEIRPQRQRPHPHEFQLYYDV